MLKQFFDEWNAALANERITRVKNDDQGNVIWQNSLITFRNTEIQIHRKAIGDGTYSAELFVPSTNKFISNKKFDSQAKCAEAILLAITPGYEKDETRRARAERRALEYRKQLMNERVEVLRKANMDKEDFEWFCELLNRNLQAGNSYCDNALTEVVAKWYPALIGDAAYLTGLPERDAKLHVERLFELAAMIIQRKTKARQGGYILRGHHAARLFRMVPDGSVRLPPGIILVKTVYREIDEYLKDSRKFMYVVQALSDFYENKLHVTAKQILAAAADRRARSKEKRLRAVEGYENRGKITVLGEASKARKVEPTAKPTANTDETTATSNLTSSIGDMFGSQLDALDVQA